MTRVQPTIFLRLGGNGALGADDLQWILYVPRREEPPISLEFKEWLPVSFVRSSKEVLLRCIREKGINLTDTGLSGLKSLPDSFDAWKAAQSPQGHGLTAQCRSQGQQHGPTAEAILARHGE
jgi:hypothetical protein